MSADTWAKVAQRQLQGALAHAVLRDTLGALGETAMATMQRGRSVSEFNCWLATRDAARADTGSDLPMQAVQPPQLGDLPDARACAGAWLDWETATVVEYQRLHDEAGDDAACASMALSLAGDAAREADAARRALASADGR